MDIPTSTRAHTGASNCECKAGFYGNYAAEQTCKACPLYTTSYRGVAFAQEDCFCKAGTYDKSTTANSALGVVCSDCNEKNNATAFYFCPANKVPQQCPLNTTVSQRFASTKAACRALPSMRYDVSVGYYVDCDVLPYSSADFTTWIPSKGDYCRHRCNSPAVVDTVNGTCRCNEEEGYKLANDMGVQRCRCRNGWYMFNKQCTICPRNSYCANEEQFFCVVSRVSNIGSVSVDNCTCLPGSYIFQSAQCRRCPAETKCADGILSINCLSEELCSRSRTIAPTPCAVGNTRLLPNTVSKSVTCKEIIYSSTQTDPPNARLYSNVVASNMVTNVGLMDIVRETEFNAKMSLAISSQRCSFCRVSALCLFYSLVRLCRFRPETTCVTVIHNNGSNQSNRIELANRTHTTTYPSQGPKT